jgi:hypothetical protein
MFRTTHDAANREVVSAVIRAELNLAGLAMRAERKVIDKIVDGLKFHSWPIVLMRISMLAHERKDSLAVSLRAFRRHGV